MADWYMEIIDCRHRGSKTGKGAAYETEADARVAFERIRAIEVKKRRAEFLCDLHADNGDLLDTILIDAAGFEALTGSTPKSADQYDEYDTAYWRKAIAEREPQIAALGNPR
jgi:hypothetical protein